MQEPHPFSREAREEAARRAANDPERQKRIADEIARRREAHRRNPRLRGIRARVIASGRATEDTVDAVIYEMPIEDFMRFREDDSEVSRVDFLFRA